MREQVLNIMNIKKGKSHQSNRNYFSPISLLSDQSTRDFMNRETLFG